VKVKHGRHPAWFAWRRLRERIGRAGHSAWKFLGPVAGSVRYQLNDAELRRVATKSAVTLITVGASGKVLHDMAFDPEIVGITVSLVATTLLTCFDTAMHLQSGAKPPPAPEPTPAPSLTDPSP